MASINKIAQFNWDKIVSLVKKPEVVKNVNVLRGKSNEILAQHSKASKPIETIDFSGYKKKLTFSARGVDKLEAAYKSTVLPKYTSTLPALEKSKREAILSNLDNVVTAAKADLNEMQEQLGHLNSIKITRESTLLDLRKRFPDIARSNEDEINQNLYIYNKTEFREYAHWAKEDHEESMCQTDGTPESQGGKFAFRVTIPLPVGEDAPCARNANSGGGH